MQPNRRPTPEATEFAEKSGSVFLCGFRALCGASFLHRAGLTACAKGRQGQNGSVAALFFQQCHQYMTGLNATAALSLLPAF
jgi:hypothetical protein